jgi:glucosamine 6-phosphate synthetase-like amidotransferase/phosphosugar isomerase protein
MLFLYFTAQNHATPRTMRNLSATRHVVTLRLPEMTGVMLPFLAYYVAINRGTDVD